MFLQVFSCVPSLLLSTKLVFVELSDSHLPPFGRGCHSFPVHWKGKATLFLDIRFIESPCRSICSGRGLIVLKLEGIERVRDGVAVQLRERAGEQGLTVAGGIGIRVRRQGVQGLDFDIVAGHVPLDVGEDVLRGG